MGGIHNGHRNRMKDRFERQGLDGFDEHNVLELLLFYAIPRSDVNERAHALMTRFGSFTGVLEAPISELKKVDGIGSSAALFLHLMGQTVRRYLISKATESGKIIRTSTDAGRYMAPYFFASRSEMVYMMCLDAKCKVISCRRVFEGDVSSVNVSVRKVVEYALADNATTVIIAHNHTSGVALPSGDDKETTDKLSEALRVVGITLSDHIIVADGDFVSIADDKMLLG